MPAGNELHAVAARQHGCVTAAQLAAAGVDRRAIARDLAAGAVRRLHRGVYLLGPVEPPLARFAAALLAVPGATLSHRSAAVVHGILQGDGPVDVLVTRKARSRQGIHVHTAAALPQSDVRVRHRLRLTSPERTLIDLAAAGDDDAFERALNEAQVNRLATTATLQAALERHRGRPGAAALRAALGTNRGFTRSEAERRLLALIRAANLPPPRTNARVGPYEVDFLWPAERLIVEVDGYAFHATRAAFERDRARDAHLQALGFRVSRVTWHQLDTAPHAVIARLAAALAVAAVA